MNLLTVLIALMAVSSSAFPLLLKIEPRRDCDENAPSNTTALVTTGSNVTDGHHPDKHDGSLTDNSFNATSFATHNGTRQHPHKCNDTEPVGVTVTLPATTAVTTRESVARADGDGDDFARIPNTSSGKEDSPSAPELRPVIGIRGTRG